MRLKRMGQKKAPFYRVVVADARSPRDGRFIDEVDEDNTKKWLANGAQPTDRVAKLLKSAGLV